METPAKTIRVQIFGEDYPLKIAQDTDLDNMTRVAEHVDRSMREIADRSPSLTQHKVAILAALNITDELFAARRTAETSQSAVDARARELRQWLDGQLARSVPASSDSPSSLVLTAN